MEGIFAKGPETLQKTKCLQKRGLEDCGLHQKNSIVRAYPECNSRGHSEARNSLPEDSGGISRKGLELLLLDSPGEGKFVTYNRS